ncbi:MAG: hypothetical protein GF308_21020 [Candidatus Heimdallarchaeota archaeon]|nr:hypothetical protein [Candidatus Heimdallarchaeota archaeon]
MPTTTQPTGMDLAEKFYQAIRGFIVIEDSGLPKYTEFLTEEKIDLILFSGLLSGLQSLSEVVSEEKIRSIETSNSKFIFELRNKYFYVLWIEKTIKNLDQYQPMITKIISRFEGATKSDLDKHLIISNLNETPDYEVIGRRLLRIRKNHNSSSTTYRQLIERKTNQKVLEKLTKEYAGIDGVLVINEDGSIKHCEFLRGKPIIEVSSLSNFLVGLRQSIRNLDPGSLEEVATQNYRFIIEDCDNYFYVFQVIKGFANNRDLDKNIMKIVSRYEGIKNRNFDGITLLTDLEDMPEHEVLGLLSLEMKERHNNKHANNLARLERRRSKMSFGNLNENWETEEEQLMIFLDTFQEAFMAGIICSNKRFFITKKVPDINDWVESVKALKFQELGKLIKNKESRGIKKLTYGGKEFRILQMTKKAFLFVVLDYKSLVAEQYLLRLSSILQRISDHL